jgi:hypothetical protein
MPAIGNATPPMTASAHMPDERTTPGSTSRGMSSRRRSSSSHSPVCVL